MDKCDRIQMDSLIIALGAVVVYVIAMAFDIFDYVIEFVIKYEAWQIDEFFTVTAYATVALAIFAFRRWKESNDEVEQLQTLRKDLLIAKNETEAANIRLSRFLTDMSHELRTPLNSIMGFSEMLLNNVSGELNDVQKEYSANISKSAAHLLHLVNQLLDLAKIQSGKIDFHIEEFAVQELFDEVNSILDVLARKKGIALTYDLDSELDLIIIDKVKLKQILFNLASNAIKFTPENGHVNVEARKDKNMLFFKVVDSGRGMSKDELDKIFDPFEQLGIMENTGYKGTGLGLTIAKDLVDMFKGEIWVESEPGKGSTFFVRVPLDLSA